MATLQTRRAGSSHSPLDPALGTGSPARSHSSGSPSASDYTSAHTVLSPEPETSDIDEHDPSLVDGNGSVDDDEEMYSDGSSSLEIPNESIDFDVVYSLRHFVATIEGQASVSKGDAMCLMDDSNSYWWLVKVLRSEDIGYIPAENIETPIERLARLNKHRNVDLASATQAERDAHPALSTLSARRARDLQGSGSSRRGTPTQVPPKPKVIFSSNFVIHNYPPAVWDAPLGEEQEEGESSGGEEWAGEEDGEGGAVAREQEMEVDTEGMDAHANGLGAFDEDMEVPDDGIAWSGEAIAAPQQQQQQAQQAQQQQANGIIRGPTPPGAAHHLTPPGTSPQQKALRQAALGNGLAPTLRPATTPMQDGTANANGSRERLLTDPSPAPSAYSASAESGVVDPAYALAQQVQMQPLLQSAFAARPAPAPAPTPGLGISSPPTAAAAQLQQPVQQPLGQPLQSQRESQSQNPRESQRDSQRESQGPLKPSAILQAQALRAAASAERDVRQRQSSAVSTGTGSSLTRTGSDGSGSAPASVRGSGSGIMSPVPEEAVGSKRARQSAEGPRKLRKQTSEDFRERADKEKEREEAAGKKKSGGLLSGLFGRKSKESKERERAERERVEREERERQQVQIAERDAARERERQQRERERLGEHTREGSDESQASFVSPPPASLQHPPAPAPQQQQEGKRSNSLTQRGQETSPATPSLVSLSSAATSPAPSTQASSRVQQLDKEQQERYAQYLATKSQSASSGLSTMSSADFATQSAAAVAQNGAAARLQHAQALAASPGPQKPSRPGSLILMSNMLPPDSLPQELSVLRVFAGEEIAVLTEATFKTVLLGANTTSRELIRQAVQRFRLPEDDTDPSPLEHPGAEGELHGEYFLTVKQADGGQEAVLMPDEKPLAVFEELSAAAPPHVSKRASFGSINSMASNLSALPAIARLPMSDFTDDSRVKFYLQRRKRDGERGVPTLSGKGLTMDGSLVRDESGIMSASSSGLVSEDLLHNNTLESSFSFSSHSTVGQIRLSSDRFSASSARFALQTVIHPSDLPDGMIFDPHTEAIVPRSALAHRSGTASASASPGVSQTERKKVFIFARNATVAEVIETSLDRFGIAEGVVDGGDDVEDRVVKRRSFTRVRYLLSVEIDGDERMLHPSSKIIDAFPRQPAFKVLDFRRSIDSKRRSMDEPSVLGSLEDIQPDDPVFILRRAPGNTPMRNSGSSRHSRHSVPLDDVALAKLHAERRASASMLSMSSDRGSNATDTDTAALSRQEIIREQRAQSRARQHGLLSAQTSDEGTNLVLPDRSQLRSTKSTSSSKVRYSYIHPDGETYDISDIIEDELGVSTSENDTIRLSEAMDLGNMSGTEDLLEEVLAAASQGRDPRSGVEQRLERVLNRVQEKRMSSSLALPTVGNTKRLSASSAHSGSFYSEDTQRSPRIDTSFAHQQQPEQESPVQPLQRQMQPPASPPSPTVPSSPISGRSSTPSPKPAGPRQQHQAHARQQPSIASVLSDLSMYDAGSSAPGSPRSPGSMPSPTVPLTTTPTTMTSSSQTSSSTTATSSGVHNATRKPMVIKSDFAGLSRMMALIQLRADMARPPKRKEDHDVDKMMFGPRMNLEDLHPSVREVFQPHFKQMEEYDQRLDRLFMSTLRSQ